MAEVLHGDVPAPAPPRDGPITVAIADDQALLRAGFRVIVEAEPDMTVIGEAGDGHVAVDVVRRLRPDVVLMDIRMPELDGLRAAEAILGDASLATAVLMLTTFDTREYVYDALRLGASGFLLKDAPAARLLDAIRVAAAGDALLEPSITRRLIEQFARVAAPPGEDGPPEAVASLTARELEVLRLLARGMSNAEIAAELVLGEQTVKTHVARDPRQARPARPRAGRRPRLRDGVRRPLNAPVAWREHPCHHEERGGGHGAVESADLLLRCARRVAVRLRHRRHLRRHPVHQGRLQALAVHAGRHRRVAAARRDVRCGLRRPAVGPPRPHASSSSRPA